MTLSYLDRQALSALAPTITADLKLTNTQYGWLGSAFSVAYLLAGPLAARWCDRLGAKRALLLGVLAWSAAAAAHSLAVGFVSFLVLRLLLGAVEAPSLPAGAQTVQAVIAPVDRARGMALLFAGMSVGSALAPPIAIGVRRLARLARVVHRARAGRARVDADLAVRDARRCAAARRAGEARRLARRAARSDDDARPRRARGDHPDLDVHAAVGREVLRGASRRQGRLRDVSARERHRVRRRCGRVRRSRVASGEARRQRAASAAARHLDGVRSRAASPAWRSATPRR